MLCNEMIIKICNYLDTNSYYLINKFVNTVITKLEKENYWYQRYRDHMLLSKVEKFFEFDPKVNWKREYLRVKRFQYWNFFNKINTEFIIKYIYMPNIPREICLFTDIELILMIKSGLKEIPKEFNNLKKLKRMYLWEQEISEIPKEIIQLPRLKYIHLGFNNIKSIPPLQGTSIKEIVLNYNQIEKISDEFSNTSLKLVNLEHNKIKEISSSIINANIKNLYLNSNELEYLPPEFCDKSNIEELYLMGNKIKKIPNCLNGTKIFLTNEEVWSFNSFINDNLRIHKL